MPYKDKQKQLAAQRKWYKRNKEAEIQRITAKKVAYRKWYNSQKEKPCADCGEDYPTYVMHWDHLPEFKKDFTIANIVRNENKKVLEEEIEKCDLVCANCHAIRTHNRKQ